jgi:uncharacterized membrane protein
MVNTTRKVGLRNSQRGTIGVLVLVAIVALLGVAALAINLSSLYVAKNEAQRAADAAALAAAESVKDAGYFANPCGVSAASMAPQALLVANAVVALNTVGGQTPVLATRNVTVTPPASVTPNPVDVQVQIVVSQAMPILFFPTILGVSTVTVSATATGDAYSTTRNPARCGARASHSVGLLGTN